MADHEIILILVRDSGRVLHRLKQMKVTKRIEIILELVMKNDYIEGKILNNP